MLSLLIKPSYSSKIFYSPVGNGLRVTLGKRNVSILMTIGSRSAIVNGCRYMSHHISEDTKIEKVIHDLKESAQLKGNSHQDSSKKTPPQIPDSCEIEMSIIQNQLCSINDTTKEILEVMKSDHIQKEILHAIQLSKAGK